MKAPDYSDQPFSSLTAIRRVYPNRPGRDAWWECRCICGTILVVRGTNLKNGYRKSCGCAWKTRSGEIPGAYLCRLRNHAKERKLKLTVSGTYLWQLFLRQKRRCALSGQPLRFGECRSTASLDRINSKRGYVHGNVQWLHKDVNAMKLNFDQDYFLKVLKSIVLYVDRHSNTAVP